MFGMNLVACRYRLKVGAFVGCTVELVLSAVVVYTATTSFYSSICSSLMSYRLVALILLSKSVLTLLEFTSNYFMGYYYGFVVCS